MTWTLKPSTENRLRYLADVHGEFVTDVNDVQIQVTAPTFWRLKT